MNLNQLSIIAFLGKDAETKFLPNGTPVVKFSAATKRSWKDDNNEWQEKTQWHLSLIHISFYGGPKEFFTHRLAASAGERVRTKILWVVP